MSRFNAFKQVSKYVSLYPEACWVGLICRSLHATLVHSWALAENVPGAKKSRHAGIEVDSIPSPAD